jgi:hypothetical protein
MNGTEFELTGCPSCGAPAEVEARAVMPTTHGDLAVVRTLCANRHWFLLPRDMLPAVR